MGGWSIGKVKGATMAITVCTHPGRCAEMEQVHSDKAQVRNVGRGGTAQPAQLAQAQATAQEWQDAL